MKALLIAAALLASSSAMAKDSMWMLCSNQEIAVNVFEHRGQDGSSRDTRINVIYGENDYTGVFNDADPSFAANAQGFQNIYVNGAAEDSEFFTGQIKIDYEAGSVVLKGNLFFLDDKIPMPIDAKLNCKKMK